MIFAFFGYSIYTFHIFSVSQTSRSDNKILKTKGRLALLNVCLLAAVAFFLLALSTKILYQGVKGLSEDKQESEVRNISPQAVVTSDPTSKQPYQAQGIQESINQDPSSLIAPIEDLDMAVKVAAMCSSDKSNAAKLEKDPYVCSQPLIAFYLRNSLIFKDDNGNYVVKDYAELKEEEKTDIKKAVSRQIWLNFYNQKEHPNLIPVQQKIQTYLDKKFQTNYASKLSEEDIENANFQSGLFDIGDYTEKIAGNILSRTKSTDEFETFLSNLDNFDYRLSY